MIRIHRLDARQTAADHTAHVPPKTGDAPALRRELGRWDLTAIGVNQVIGGAVFLMPALVAANVGRWSWILVGLVGVASMTIALSFAEAAAASRAPAVLIIDMRARPSDASSASRSDGCCGSRGRRAGRRSSTG